MPPRTRKTAETAPPAPDTSTAPGEDEQAPESAGTESQEPVAESAATAEAPGAAAAQPEATYHWETPAGTPADPCRACPPGGPPPGAGSYGCPHGQWVRVQDAD